MRTCSKCGEAKPLEEFHRSNRCPSGRRWQCRTCVNAYSAAWSKANHQRRLSQQRGRRAHDGNELGENVYTLATQARTRGAAVVEPKVCSLVLLEEQDGMCGICGEDLDPFAYEIDHIVPIAEGGEHSYANTRVTHRTCNRRAGAIAAARRRGQHVKAA